MTFSGAFYDVYFESYSDTPSYTKCLEKVYSAIRDEDCIPSLFTVADV